MAEDRTTLFARGPYYLSSGVEATWKVECDALTPADWAGLAAIAMERFGLVFGRTVGVPRGGLSFAIALAAYQTGDPADCVLLVDDVLTTGESMQRAAEVLMIASEPVVLGLVAFARGPLPMGCRAVWELGGASGWNGARDV